MLSMRGLENAVVFDLLGGPATETSTVTGTGADASDTDDLVYLIQDVGTVSGTTPSLAGKLQQSAASGSGYADCTAILALTAVTATGNVQIGVYFRDKQYIRYIGTITGTTPSFALAVLALATPKKF